MHSPPFPSATTKFTPLLIVSNQLYLLKMKSGLLQGRLGHLHCMQRNWLAPDKKPQLPNERQLHHCLHVSDGWQCWQTGGINWQGDQGETSLHFTPPFALVLIDWRCIFIQIQQAYDRDRWPGGACVLLQWVNAKHLLVPISRVYSTTHFA